jgi:hypothetical protein
MTKAVENNMRLLKATAIAKAYDSIFLTPSLIALSILRQETNILSNYSNSFTEC